MDTIYALASGSYRAGVSVIRISGPASLATLEALSSKKGFSPRAATLVTLTDPASKKEIDRAIAIFFKAPASFTGDDVVEYHVHGGRAVIDGLLKALAAFPGCRMAEAGEFTRRGFENGKMDLTEAEAIADLIAAETEAQRGQALSQLGGALSQLYQGWTDKLTKTLAHQEAEIEFPEEDLPPGLDSTLAPEVKKLLAEIMAHLNDNRRGERLRDGVRIAIIGAPNAGKSSLLNALAKREAAIVSTEAGTTRDVIEVHMDLGGYPVIIADTAGIRDTESSVEKEGIRRAESQAAAADLKIALFDGTLAALDARTLALAKDRAITVFSKSDIAAPSLAACRTDGERQFSLSTVTGDGMDVFLKALTLKVAELFKGGETGMPALTRARHREALVEAASALEKSLNAELPELAAEDLRLALRALGRITGRVHVEELLDRIFRDFCIGK